MEYLHPCMKKEEVGAISALGLAHMGDGVFELLVRTYLCTTGLAKNGQLHQATVAYVSAPAQAAFLNAILPALTADEAAIYRRGRNAHVHAVPKNATPGQYSRATGLETLLGSLYLTGQTERIEALFALGMEALHAL